MKAPLGQFSDTLFFFQLVFPSSLLIVRCDNLHNSTQPRFSPLEVDCMFFFSCGLQPARGRHRQCVWFFFSLRLDLCRHMLSPIRSPGCERSFHKRRYKIWMLDREERREHRRASPRSVVWRNMTSPFGTTLNGADVAKPLVSAACRKRTMSWHHTVSMGSAAYRTRC